jgi:hypothetical protein
MNLIFICFSKFIYYKYKFIAVNLIVLQVQSHKLLCCINIKHYMYIRLNKNCVF